MDAKNFPKALDKTAGALCEGTIKLTKTGFHDLEAVHGGGTVYIDSDGNSASVNRYDANDVTFYVTKTPAPTLGTLSISSFNELAAHVGADDCSLSNNFCEGNDVNEDGEVNNLDVFDVLDEAGSNIDIEDDANYSFTSEIEPGGSLSKLPGDNEAETPARRTGSSRPAAKACA